MNEKLKEIMSTTELGETVVLKETEINTYIRCKKGLKRIDSESVEIVMLNNPHHQYQ